MVGTKEVSEQGGAIEENVWKEQNECTQALETMHTGALDLPEDLYG